MNLRNFRPRPSLDQAATGWLARRDRGLSPREQDEYLQWLRENEQHAAAIARAEATMRRVLQLSAWRREHSAEPNPDLLAPPRQRRSWRWTALTAVAACLFLGIVWRSVANAPIPPRKDYLHVNERVALPDGSLAELRDGTQLDVLYSDGERRVRLWGGQAQFSVMKNPARPFVVEAGGVAVRALGTVFMVQLGSEAVEVLVTEGRVHVGATAPGSAPATGAGEPAIVAAGQRAIVSRAESSVASVVDDLSPEEIRRALEWQAPRLQFHETLLSDAIVEFNRRNRRQLVLGNAALGAEMIGGTFRPDNVDGFVRLLSLTLGVRAVPHGPDEIVLFGRK